MAGRPVQKKCLPTRPAHVPRDCRLWRVSPRTADMSLGSRLHPRIAARCPAWFEK